MGEIASASGGAGVTDYQSKFDPPPQVPFTSVKNAVFSSGHEARRSQTLRGSGNVKVQDQNEADRLRIRNRRLA